MLIALVIIIIYLQHDLGLLFLFIRDLYQSPSSSDIHHSTHLYNYLVLLSVVIIIHI